MFISLLGVTDRFKGFKVALASFIKHLAPVVTVGNVKVFVETDGRCLGRAIDAVRQLVALGHFLATGLEDAGTRKECVQQVLQFFVGVAFSALHGALGIAAGLGGGRAFFAQGGAGRFERDDGVGQLGFVLGAQKGK